jgi:SecD/SecF fusion protein
MQGKGLVQFFFILLALVCLWYFSLWIPTNNVEKAADSYAAKMAATASAETKTAVAKIQRSRFLDSMSTVEVFGVPGFKKYTYTDLKQSQLALGLDLKGGMSLLCQVDLSSMIEALSGNTSDPQIKLALANATKRMEATQSDYVTLFAEEWNKLKTGRSLSSLFYSNPSLSSTIKLNTDDATTIAKLRVLGTETVTQTHDQLKQRIDKLGVVQPNVSLDAARGLIMVELPGVDNPERARDLVTGQAKLEFWEVYRGGDNGIIQAFQTADQRIQSASNLGVTTPVTDDSTRLAGGIVDSTGKLAAAPAPTTLPADSTGLTSGPLLSKLTLVGSPQSAILGVANKNNMNLINEYLARPAIRALFPRDGEFRWSKKSSRDENDKATGQFELYLLKRGKDGPALDGQYVTDAFAAPNDNGQIAVNLRMNPEGARRWGAVTKRAADDGQRQVAIVLDDEVVSAPSVRDAILTGSSEISGGFTAQEGEDLAGVLKVGKLPARPQIVQESIVGPTLGAENIKKSLMALLLSLLAVMAFMGWYYRKGGWIANIALLANLFFLVGTLMSLGTVLTLPGMAGIVLNMGMAVDANVIIYERIREELRNGVAWRDAITKGYKESLSAIIDGNLTTFLMAMVLIYFGIGPIKGFGVVLAIGIICTLFTALLLSRLIIDWQVNRGNEITFFSKTSERFANMFNYDWMKMRKKAYLFSGLIILAGFVSFFTRGFDLGVEFTGGYEYSVKLNKAVTIDELNNTLKPLFDNKSTVIKTIDTDNAFSITTAYLQSDNSTAAQDKVTTQLFTGLQKLTGATTTLDQFKAIGSNTDVKLLSARKVSAVIADDITKSAKWATIFGFLAIFLYILIRFSRWQYSAGGVIALVHDVLITLSVFSLFHGLLPWSLEVDGTFIASILTIIGYSINDTVIIFDRIREYVRNYNKEPMPVVINKAINSTLSRTIVTSLTVFIVLLVLFIFGGASIRGFSFAMLIGVVAGTYSSIFIAAPIMLDLSKNADLSEVRLQTVVEKIAAREEAEGVGADDIKPAKKGKEAKS